MHKLLDPTSPVDSRITCQPNGCSTSISATRFVDLDALKLNMVIDSAFSVWECNSESSIFDSPLGRQHNPVLREA